MQDSQVARRSVAQVERQFETSGLLLRAVQSSFMVSDDIDQQQFADVHDNLHAQEVLPSLVAMVFARRSEPERPGGPPGYRYESVVPLRSEEHTSELQSLMRISYAVFRLKK